MKRLLPLLAILLWASNAFADVGASDGSGTNKNTTGFNAGLTTGVSLTTYTVGSASNRCLVGILQTSSATNDGTISSSAMTWNGTAMTSRAVANNTAGGRSEMFVLPNPASGNNTMAATYGAAVVDAIIIAIELDGADQSTCIATGDTVQTTGNGASPDIAITSTTDGATIAAFTSASSIISGGADPQTDLYFDNSTWVNSGGNYALGGTSNNHSVNVASAQYSMVGVHVIIPAVSTCRGALLLLGVGGC